MPVTFFLPAPSPRPRPPAGRPVWRRLLLAAAAGVGAASLLPWVLVRMTTLFGDLLGPPAWQGTTGMTCLCTTVLLAVMTMGESGAAATRRAVRPASLVLAAVMTALFVATWWQGPGSLRGVSATWTTAFYAGGVALAALTLACWMRALELRYSSSGPPT